MARFIAVIIAASLGIIITFPIALQQLGLSFALIIYALLLILLTHYFIKIMQSKDENPVLTEGVPYIAAETAVIPDGHVMASADIACTLEEGIQYQGAFSTEKGILSNQNLTEQESIEQKMEMLLTTIARKQQEPEFMLEPELEPDLESEPELEPELQPEAKAETEPEQILEPELEPDLESEPELEPELQPETEAETEPEQILEPELEPELQPEAEAETEPELILEPELEPELQPEPEPEA
ncbi:MAG: hypothetical protein PHF24_09115, partial [Syntrophomonas sp.]|nr:hypothetical protein [Syntrophomonas sp.]